MQRLPVPMQWLEQHVPLSLLIDLLEPTGPDSRRIHREEPADISWVPQHDAA